LVVITFHSLEDSIVKKFLNKKSGKSEGVSRHYPRPAEELPKSSFELLARHAHPASDEEISINIRARSAKLRAAIRIKEEARAI